MRIIEIESTIGVEACDGCGSDLYKKLYDIEFPHMATNTPMLCHSCIAKLQDVLARFIAGKK